MPSMLREARLKEMKDDLRSLDTNRDGLVDKEPLLEAIASRSKTEQAVDSLPADQQQALGAAISDMRSTIRDVCHNTPEAELDARLSSAKEGIDTVMGTIKGMADDIPSGRELREKVNPLLRESGLIGLSPGATDYVSNMAKTVTDNMPHGIDMPSAKELCDAVENPDMASLGELPKPQETPGAEAMKGPKGTSIQI